MKRFLVTSITGAAVIGLVYILPKGTWASLGSLPLHPLIVHGVVVLLPLIALAIIPLLFNRIWLGRFHFVVTIALAGVTVAVVAATSSGNSLAAAVGLPKEHAEWGNLLLVVAALLYGTFVLYALIAVYLPSKKLTALLGLVVGLVALTSLGLTFLVGHSGARSVWESKYQSSKVPIALSQSKITMDEVAQHATPDDCWTVIDGHVYDMTSFLGRHPAGERAIERLCGRDGTRDFNGEHSGENEPGSWLETLKIGKLVP